MISEFFDVFDWRLVRAYGALTVLTRASYLMLVVVPILAGTWPGVHMIVDKASNALVHIADNVTKNAQRLLNQSKEQESLRKNPSNKNAGPEATSSKAIDEGKELDDVSRLTSKLVNDAERMSNNLNHLTSSLPR